MPMNFDPRFLAVTGGVSSAVLGVVLFLLRRGFPSSVHGLRHWAWGAMAGFAGGLLLSGRGILPDVVSIVLGNQLIAGGFVLFYLGTRRFYGLDGRRRYWLLALGLYFALNLWFTAAAPDFDVRLLLFAAFVGGTNLAHARVVIANGAGTMGGQMLAIVLVADVVLLLGRAVFAIAGIAGDLFTPGAIQAVYLGTFTAFSALLTISLVVLSTERLKKDLEFLSTHDFLTGALSRRALFEFGERAIASCARHGRPVAVAMLDLDHFKRINDLHGHQVGDEVLADFTRRCLARLRTSDLFGRYGGEEFLAILPDTTAAEAAAVAERIRSSVELAGTSPVYTVSVGVADRTPDRTTLQELTRDADGALYRAKSNGRNRVEVT